MAATLAWSLKHVRKNPWLQWHRNSETLRIRCSSSNSGSRSSSLMIASVTKKFVEKKWRRRAAPLQESREEPEGIFHLRDWWNNESSYYILPNRIYSFLGAEVSFLKESMSGIPSCACCFRKGNSLLALKTAKFCGCKHQMKCISRVRIT